MILNRIISVVIGYFFGIFLSGYAYGKTKNKDITTMGSGNAGTTNTLRVFGWKAGAVTLLGDVLKAVFAVVLVWLLFHKSEPEGVRLLELYAGFGAILGHNFPFYMLLRKKDRKLGGKGFACSVGLACVFSPIVIPIGLAIFAGTVALTRYVSLGSIFAWLSFLVQVVVFGELGLLDVTTAYKIEIYVVVACIVLLGIVRHQANIKRLLNGTENKLTLKKNKEGTVK